LGAAAPALLARLSLIWQSTPAFMLKLQGPNRTVNLIKVHDEGLL